MKETYPSACCTKSDRVSCVGLCGLLAAQFNKERVGLSDAQQLRSLGNHREIPRRQLVEGPKPRGWIGLEEATEARLTLLGAQRQESDG